MDKTVKLKNKISGSNAGGKIFDKMKTVEFDG